MTPRRLGGLAGAAALIAAITLLARVVGFGRWLVYSHAVSGLCVGNAYSAANQVPNILFEVVAGGALAGAVVPLLAGPLARAADHPDDPTHAREVDRITSALLAWTILLLVPAALVLAVAAPALGGWLVDEAACPGAAELATRFLRVFAPQVVLYGLGVVLTGVLTARHRFAGPALAPLISSLVVIGAYLGFSLAVGPSAAVRNDAAGLPAAGEAWLAWGTTAGVVAMTVPLLVPLWRSGVRVVPTLRFPPGVARRALALAGAGLVALLAQQASVVALLGIQRGSGDPATLNIFQYSQAVYLLPYAVLVVPLATASFPRLATHAARADTAAFAAAARTTTHAVVVISALGAGVLVAAARPVAGFFGLLDRADVSAIAPTLAWLAPGLIGFALIAHVGRALYALERGRAAATATVAGWLTVVVAMLVAGSWLDGSRVAIGLGAATSIGMTVAAIGLFAALRRCAGPEAIRGLVRACAVAVLANGLAAGAGWWLATWLENLWGAGLFGVLGAGVSAAACCLLIAVPLLALLDRDALRLVLRRGVKSGDVRLDDEARLTDHATRADDRGRTHEAGRTEDQRPDDQERLIR